MTQPDHTPARPVMTTEQPDEVEIREDNLQVFEDFINRHFGETL